VQRQWCGHTGKTDNCIVTVHLAYAADDFHCLLGGELFLPESWSEDRERCRRAKIPDDMVYRPKWKIALELLDRANSNGVAFFWMTFDEGYGGKPTFLRALRQRKQAFIGEVPSTFTGWLDPPRVTHRPFRRRRGRGRQTPRIVSGSPPAHAVAYLLEGDPRLRDQRWKRYRVKDGVQGPMVWEIKRAWLYGKDERELPERKPWLLVVARNVLHPEELKYFIGDAPRGTDVTQFLLAAFSRWRVERCFEDQKDELGLDHYEGRRYPGLKRHLAISAVSYLFLSRVHQQWRGEKIRVDGLPSPHRGGRVAPVLVAHRSCVNRPDREYRKENPRDATR